MGDGNFHQIVLYDPDDERQRKAVSDCVNSMMVRAIEMEGTVTGEHGVGIGKKASTAPIFLFLLLLILCSVLCKRSLVRRRLGL